MKLVVIVVASLTSGTGNCVTATRIASHFVARGDEVHLLDSYTFHDVQSFAEKVEALSALLCFFLLFFKKLFS
jgi:hypothetical protein